ncbi:MAG TPA: SDR family oxidoreductase [Polyangiaceae bacterium]
MGNKGSSEAYLVTGYPGFRARKMVEHLLHNERSSEVFLVVRSQFGQQAGESLDQLSASERARVEILEGDAVAMDLGLSGKEYKELAARITRIHHMAQVTHPAVDQRTAEQVNIGATREIIEFARACARLEGMVVFSSASVSGTRSNLVLEEDLNAGQSFRTPVEETLARAEQLVRSCMKALPVSVVRPTQVVGDSRTGEVDRLDGPYLLILLIVSSPQDFPLPLPTSGDAPIHLVPIDYVVSAAHVIGRQRAAMGRTFHLADPHPLSVRRMFELVARSGGRRLPTGFIPTNVTKALLRTPGVNLFAKSPKAFLDMLATPVRYDTRNTEEALRGTGLVCPPFESYVDELVAFVKRRVQERRDRGDEAEIEDPLS